MNLEQELPRYQHYVGATGRRIRLQATDRDGAAVDLTSKTVKLSGRLGAGSGTVNWKFEAATMTVEDGTDGYIYIDPSADQVDEKGEYMCQVRIETASAPDYLQPFILDVQDPVHFTS